MKKLIKLALIVGVIVLGVKLIDANRGNGAAMVGIVACGGLLIWLFGKSNKGKARSGGGYSSGGSSSVGRSEDWYKLYDIARIYSGYQNLRDYAKVEFVVSLDDYNTFTIDAYLDLSDCDSDVNMNDIRSSLRYAAQQLQKNILADARSATNANVTVQMGRVE